MNRSKIKIQLVCPKCGSKINIIKSKDSTETLPRCMCGNKFEEKR